jgi:hypothetical protein
MALKADLAAIAWNNNGARDSSEAQSSKTPNYWLSLTTSGYIGRDSRLSEA